MLRHPTAYTSGFFKTIAGGAASGEASEQTYAAASERYGIHWIA